MFEETVSRHKLLLAYPASWWRNMWREALPSGNGETGAAVYGGIQHETILINHAELWHLGQKQALPDVSDTLKRVRQYMDEGDYHQANWLLANTLKEKKYEAKLAKPLPLVHLNVTMDIQESFTNYQRGVNMETGEVSVEWTEKDTKYQRNLFVSRADSLIVYEIRADQKNKIDASIRLTLPPTDTPRMQHIVQQRAESTVIQTEPDYYYFKGKDEDGSEYGAVARVIADDGECEETNDRLQYREVSKLFVLIKVFTEDETGDKWDALKEELALENRSYQQLLSEHVAEHSTLFQSADFSLEVDDTEFSNEVLLLDAYQGKVSNALMEKLWAYGRYLFISATKARGQPFSMYGLWAGDYDLMWSHRMANENIQMMYWHAGVGNLTSLIPSLFSYYESLLDDFRDNARKLFGCRGIYIPAGTTPGNGKPNQIVPVIMNWTSAAGWLAQHFYDYYQFTQDQDFLENHAIPFMKETLLFYQDFLVETEEGTYQYYPSVSPENTPSNYMPKNGENLAHPMPTTINATMDFAILKELLTNLLDSCTHISHPVEEVKVWREMLAKIPDYQLNSEGAVGEWMSPKFIDNYHHRHLSHLYPLFPGQEIIFDKEDSLSLAFQKAVNNRKLGAQTSWSYAHMAAIYARLQDGEKALECLENITRSCLLPNFFTVHNDWRRMGMSMNVPYAPVQLDASLGIVNAIQEMLLFVSSKTMKILPSFPGKWRKGNVRNFRFHTGTISFSWDVDQEILDVEMTADQDTDIQVQLPKFVSSIQADHASSWTQIDVEQNIFHITLPKHQKVLISSTSR
ncbi:glycoside hydrolase N-terminal domain-containing protein [Gracilibacillus sp. YIM 98692]|uniref:glycosyl hydrolase family 95 catalytic domain-containing protein n=1 Tax=Gracilibacillus sp. YIM 98692 TaxID=2663532 RepID=UPI0013D3D25E|nr:glycoside hydrolase N-terminal domain-containing protein [Gracilibacillus sp. YIM 98692]